MGLQYLFVVMKHFVIFDAQCSFNIQRQFYKKYTKSTMGKIKSQVAACSMKCQLEAQKGRLPFLLLRTCVFKHKNLYWTALFFNIVRHANSEICSTRHYYFSPQYLCCGFQEVPSPSDPFRGTTFGKPFLCIFLNKEIKPRAMSQIPKCIYWLVFKYNKCSVFNRWARMCNAALNILRKAGLLLSPQFAGRIRLNTG